MPVMIMYKAKSIPNDVSAAISEELSKVTRNLLKEAIEVRVIEHVQVYNANELHVEVRFRNTSQYSDELLQKYHEAVMFGIDAVLTQQDIKCAYSFYIIPSLAPPAIWGQAKT
jgi:hypothetical protein